MITPRDLQVLLALVRYFVLSRPQIQRLLFHDDTNGRSTRRRLQMLVELDAEAAQSEGIALPRDFAAMAELASTIVAGKRHEQGV